MVIVMQEGASDEQIQRVIDRLVAMGFDIHRSTGATHTVLGAVGIKTDFDPRDIELLDGVREVVRITQPYKLASRHFRPEGTIVDEDRKNTRLNSSHLVISYAVFCLKKKKIETRPATNDISDQREELAPGRSPR